MRSIHTTIHDPRLKKIIDRKKSCKKKYNCLDFSNGSATIKIHSCRKAQL